MLLDQRVVSALLSLICSQIGDFGSLFATLPKEMGNKQVLLLLALLYCRLLFYFLVSAFAAFRLMLCLLPAQQRIFGMVPIFCGPVAQDVKATGSLCSDTS